MALNKERIHLRKPDVAPRQAENHQSTQARQPRTRSNPASTRIFEGVFSPLRAVRLRRRRARPGATPLNQENCLKGNLRQQYIRCRKKADIPPAIQQTNSPKQAMGRGGCVKLITKKPHFPNQTN